MSASTKIPAVHVLRGILRKLKVNAKELPTIQQQEHVASRIRSAPSAHVLDRYRSDEGGKPQEMRKLAYEYMLLRQDIDERCRLQRLDTGAEKQLSPKEMSRRAAARAGLELPTMDPDYVE